MPLRMYDYWCPECGDVSRDHLVSDPYPETAPCECGSVAQHVVTGMPAIKAGNAPMTEAKDIWEGFGPGLEDSDGINQTHYESTKSFF